VAEVIGHRQHVVPVRFAPLGERRPLLSSCGIRCLDAESKGSLSAHPGDPNERDRIRRDPGEPGRATSLRGLCVV
jgi:hypothetical protein